MTGNRNPALADLYGIARDDWPRESPLLIARADHDLLMKKPR
jgi:hypothetical protein